MICAHNEERHLVDQLTALIEQPTRHLVEIIVVDNKSTDSTPSIVHEFEQRDARTRLVTANERADKSYAMNAGVKASTADRIAFCDGDDIVSTGWLDAMASSLEGHRVITGPHELDLLNPRWLADSRGRSMEEDAVGSFAGIFPCIRGASWGVRRSVWDQLGGMNERYHPVEDIEFSFRCWLEGIDIAGVPDAMIHYRYRDSTRALWRQGFAYGSHRPLIARLVAESGRGKIPRFAGWKSWLMLVARLPWVIRSEQRAAWVWTAGNRIGQLVGSVRYRHVML